MAEPDRPPVTSDRGGSVENPMRAPTRARLQLWLLEPGRELTSGEPADVLADQLPFALVLELNGQLEQAPPADHLINEASAQLDHLVQQTLRQRLDERREASPTNPSRPRPSPQWRRRP
jgi:hypothetical protein